MASNTACLTISFASTLFMENYNTTVLKKVNTSVFSNLNTFVLISALMKYGDRLKTARKHKGISQNELSEISGVGQGSISKIERGDQEYSAFDIELATALDIQPIWLKTGDPRYEPSWIPPPNGSYDSRSLSNHPSSSVMDKNIDEGPPISRNVPLISWVQAGIWTESINNYHNGDAEDWIPTTALVSSTAFALRVKGDSMTNPHGAPSIPEGYIIIVDPNKHPENGDLVIARLDESMETTFKKLVIDGPKKYLKPLNPAYPAIEITGNCTICGTVVKIEWEP